MELRGIKPSLWGAAGGAVVVLVVGFTWGGWITESKAKNMTLDAVEEAVVSRLAPMCVEHYKQDANNALKLKKLKKMEYWNRGEFVEKQGWATMTGEKDPDSKVSRKCHELLSEIAG